jgi:hypothetical protein
MVCMPWWALLYLILFVGFSIVADGLIEAEGQHSPRWWESLQHAIIALLFAGFWLHPIYHTLGFTAPVLFVACVIWELYTMPADLRAIWQDEELTKGERLSLTILVPVLCWPLFIIAGIGVFTFQR